MEKLKRATKASTWRSLNAMMSRSPPSGSRRTKPCARITTRAARVTGWTVFLNAPVRNCGRPSRFPMPGTELRRGGRRTTQWARAGALTEGRSNFARRKRGAGNVVAGASERASQVIFGIGMTARELRTGQTENGFHPRCGNTLQEQFFGDPEVRDTPIGPGKALRNLEAAQPGLIERVSLMRGECRVGRCGKGWGRMLVDRRFWRDTGQRGALRRSMPGSLQQGAAVRGQVSGGVLELHPGRQSIGQAPLRLLIGKPGKSSHVAPVCAGPICLIQSSQVPADWSCHIRRQRPPADPNPSLKMSRAGLDYDAGFVPVVAHGGQDQIGSASCRGRGAV